MDDVRTLAERGQLSEDDELSENGGPWLAISDVPDLVPIFARNRTRRGRRATPQGLVATPQKATLLGVGHHGTTATRAPAGGTKADGDTRVGVPGARAPQSVGGQPRQSPQTITGYTAPIAVPIPVAPAPVVPEPIRVQASPPAPVAAPVPQPAPPTPRPSFSSPPPAEPKRSARPKERANLYLDEVEKPVVRSKSKSGVGTFVVALLAAALGAGGFYAYTKYQGQQTRAPLSASVMLVAEGDSQAAADTHEAYRIAVATLDQAHHRYPDQAGPLAGLARTHAFWAQSLLFEAKDATSSPVPAEVARAETLRELARQHAAEAWRYADRARVIDAHDVHVLVAAADAARLSSRLPEAQTFLDEAMRGRTGMSGHPHYVKALLAYGPALEDHAAALADAERAVAVEPDRPAFRLLLARIELGRGEDARARAAVDLVLAEAPEHSGARALARSLDARAMATAASDAGVEDDEASSRRRRRPDYATPSDLP